MIVSRLLEGIPDFVFGMSGKQGGVGTSPFGMNISYNVGDSEERVRANRKQFFGSLGVTEGQLAIPGQVHGTEVMIVDRPGAYEACDALLTAERGLCLCVTVADCVPVILVDTNKHLVCSVHAGWRGTAGGIVGKAVGVMTQAFHSRPTDIVAYLGPAARDCCYAVGEDVAARFPASTVIRRDGEVFVDLYTANALQLELAGVPAVQIETSPLCTICNSDLLHSYRRDRTGSGRMMAVAGFTLRS